MRKTKLSRMKKLRAMTNLLERILPQSVMENYIYEIMLKLMIKTKKAELLKVRKND